jgi:prepilin-type N-terminal cleavage/methylation domain-containing protein
VCGRAMRNSGFTLIEMMTVIAVVAVLFAIMIPIGRRMREDNRTSMCELNLQSIYRGLKMYRLDEGAYPYLDPLGVPDADHPDAGEPPPYHDPLDPTGPPTAQSWEGRRHYGLLKLLDAGYITNPKTLECPRDPGPRTTSIVPDTTGVSSIGPYESYCIIVDETGAPIMVTHPPTGIDHPIYKYQPNRRWQEAGEPPFTADWYRQLASGVPTDPSDLTIQYADFSDRYWMPRDSAIITWCDYHARTYTRGGKNQYIVLFQDGRIQPRPEDEFMADLENAWRNALPEEGE